MGLDYFCYISFRISISFTLALETQHHDRYSHLNGDHCLYNSVVCFCVHYLANMSILLQVYSHTKRYKHLCFCLVQQIIQYLFYLWLLTYSSMVNYLGLTAIHTVDNPVFRRLLSGLDPKFRCPRRNYFSRTAIPDYYNQEKKKLMSDLLGAQW